MQALCPCSAPFATGLNCALQVVYWDALQKAQEGELSSQTEVFGGEQGQHRLKDFKCVHLSSSCAQCVFSHMLHTGCGLILMLIFMLTPAATRCLARDPEVALMKEAQC